MMSRVSQNNTVSRVLIADDDPSLRLLYRKTLERAGFEAIVVEDGETLLRRLAHFAPDIVLLDLRMPGIDGFEVCRRLGEEHPELDVPIVIVTGQRDIETVEQAYEMGATDFITKPVIWSALPYRLNFVLRSHRAVRKLRASEEHNRSLIAAMPDKIVLLGPSGKIVQDYVRAERPSPVAHLQDGKTLEEWLPPDAARKARECLHGSLAMTTVQTFEYSSQDPVRHYETRMIPRSDSTVLTIIRDITDKKAAERKIHELAFFDQLTGLPNRQYFIRDLRRAMAHSKRHGTHLAVIYIDLDQFKRINDTLGHIVGDALLKSVSDRLKSAIRLDDSIARMELGGAEDPKISRLGGDEFVVLLTDIQSDEDAADAATRFQSVLAEPFTYDDHHFVVTPSIGIAIYPEHGETVEELLMRADMAMYRAKNSGRNRYFFFSETMNVHSLERLDLEADLRQAIDNDELMLFYQPKVRAADGSVIGCEALIRWRRQDDTWIPPAEFIPIAEEAGLIGAIGEWVIREACQQICAWARQGLVLDSVAINISGQQFQTPDFLEAVLKILWDAGVRPGQLDLEITETLLMQDVDETVEMLKRFQQAGFRLSVDDFGTGYSSLSYLRRFPLTAVKIDRSFVSASHVERDDAAICAAIVAMARELGLKVIAEGVELEEHWQLLAGQGCDELQGYFFSKPLSAEHFFRFVRDYQPRDKGAVTVLRDL
jgi:diguanylate cyclase (GGDEF)-like protein